MERANSKPILINSIEDDSFFAITEDRKGLLFYAA
jgi:hypothetical protein